MKISEKMSRQSPAKSGTSGLILAVCLASALLPPVYLSTMSGTWPMALGYVAVVSALIILSIFALLGRDAATRQDSA